LPDWVEADLSARPELFIQSDSFRVICVLSVFFVFLSIKVSFYAPASLCERTSKRLRRHGIVLQPLEAGTDSSRREGGGSGGRGDGASGGRSVVVAKMDGSRAQLSSQKALEDLFDRLSSDTPAPSDVADGRKALAGKLSAVLLPHQEEGVAWMMVYIHIFV